MGIPIAYYGKLTTRKCYCKQVEEDVGHDFSTGNTGEVVTACPWCIP